MHYVYLIIAFLAFDLFVLWVLKGCPLRLSTPEE